jgi:hypothetical protein
VTGKLYRTTDLVAKLDPASPNGVELQPGQVARFTFSASAGDKIGVSLVRTVPGDKTMIYVKLVKPDGGWAFSRVILPAEVAMQVEPVALPATGIYTFVIDAGFNKASAAISLIR